MQAFSSQQYDRLAKALVAEGAGPLKSKADLEEILSRPVPESGKGGLPIDRAIIEAARDHFDAKTDRGYAAFYTHSVGSAVNAFLNPEPEIPTRHGVRARDRAKQVAGQVAASIDRTIRTQVEYGQMGAARIDSATDKTITIGKHEFERRAKGELPEVAGVTQIEISTLADPTYRFGLKVRVHDKPNNDLRTIGRLDGERANPAKLAFDALEKNHGYKILGVQPGRSEGTFVLLFTHPDFASAENQP